MPRLGCVTILLVTFASGCPNEQAPAMSVSDAQQALVDSSLASQAETLLSAGVEISTQFAIGAAVEQAASELQSFVASELPCASITRQGAILTVTYGALSGACSYRGHTFSGGQTIQVMRNAANEVAVHHAWSDFNDGHVSLSGSADVVWNSTTTSRHVTHDIDWSVLSGTYIGQHGSNHGDRTETPLADGGISSGLRIDGTRAWDGPLGRDELDIDGVEVRWSDPVPQAGAYVLTSPSDLPLTLAFDRTGAETIRVSATSGTRTFSFLISSDGRVAR